VIQTGCDQVQRNTTDHNPPKCVKIIDLTSHDGQLGSAGRATARTMIIGPGQDGLSINKDLLQQRTLQRSSKKVRWGNGIPPPGKHDRMAAAADGRVAYAR
jgi:hypothetical protein